MDLRRFMIGEFRAFSARFGASGVWLGVVGEILIVTLGVLLAFGLNAWWVERAARSDEQTHLRALARDFERNVGVFKVLLERDGVFQSLRAEPAHATVVSGDSGAAESYAELLAAPAFQEHVAFRYLSEREVASAYRGLLSEAEAIHTRVQAQLDP